MTSTLNLATWTPIRVAVNGGPPAITWCYTGDTPFDDPFFDQTVERCLRRPFPLLFQQTTSLADAERLVAAAAPPEPAGFVFHASRCGSTLVAQMAAALPGVHVLSEPPLIDTILRSRYTVSGVSDDQLGSWVRTIILALSRPGSRSVVKFDSWTTVELPLLRRAFPDVPWIFLYRDPAEIISSQMRRRGAHMIPGVLPFGLVGIDIAEVAEMAPEVYCARVLAAILAAALEEIDRDPGRSLVANYRRLPALMPDAIAPLFSLAGERDAMLDVATRDAKNPSLAFVGANGARPSAAEAEAAARWAGPLYDRLEALA